MSELSVFESAKQDYEKKIYDLKQEIEYLRSVGSVGILDRKCKELQNINEKLSLALESAENKIDKIKEMLGNYKHYSTPDEKQNAENEKIIEEVYQILHENLYKLKELKENK